MIFCRIEIGDFRCWGSGFVNIGIGVEAVRPLAACGDGARADSQLVIPGAAVEHIAVVANLVQVAGVVIVGADIVNRAAAA